MLHERNGIDGVLGELGAILLEAGELLLDIVLEQLAVSLLEARRKSSELLLKDLLIEDLGEPNSASLYLCQTRSLTGHLSLVLHLTAAFVL